MSCQQTFVSPVWVVGLSKLHLLHQSCGSRANRSSNNLASLKLFVLQKLNDILGLGLVIYLKIEKNAIVKWSYLYVVNDVDI